MVDALIGAGAGDAVLSPGSRSAPLAFALADAERHGRIRLHVRIDERSAGFLALGLAKASGRPVPVVVTSGTAVANLMPAVVEASYAGVPLIVLSADRPPALRGTGASQTIDQVKIFGENVRHFADVAVAANLPGQVPYWRSVVGRAVGLAGDPADPGPVHLNLPFDEPLVPTAEPRFEHRGAPGGPSLPWLRHPGAPQSPALPEVLAGLGLRTVPERGVVVVGDLPDPRPEVRRAIAHLAEACGWPIIAEPTASLHHAPTWLPAGPLVAGSGRWLREHEPELIVSIGRVGLTRTIGALQGAARHHLVIDPTRRWADAGRTATAVLSGTVPAPPEAMGTPAGSAWLSQWRRASEAASRSVEEVLDAEGMFTGLHVARHVWRNAPEAALLFLAASWPIRQVFLTASARPGLQVMANRGANGIDGLVSTAWGAAAAHEAGSGGPTVALLGDLAFLHDSNGLLAPAQEPRPPLRYVVIDNDGGGIFSQLEQGGSAYRADFERVFGTPHGLHLVGRARLCGVAARGVEDLDTFAGAFAQQTPGVSVLVAQVADRASEAELLGDLQAQAAEAVAHG